MPRTPARRRNGFPRYSRTGKHRHGKLNAGTGIEIAGRLNVRHHTEIAACLGKCLGEQPGTPLSPVAKPDRDFLARTKISAMLPDGQDLAPWSLAAHAAVFKRKSAFAVALRRHIVWFGGIGGLQAARVTDGPSGNADAAGIVDPQGADSVGQGEALKRADLYRIGRREGRGSQHCGVRSGAYGGGVVSDKVGRDG